MTEHRPIHSPDVPEILAAELPAKSWAVIRVERPGDMYARHKMGLWREISSGLEITEAELLSRVNAEGWEAREGQESTWRNHVGFAELLVPDPLSIFRQFAAIIDLIDADLQQATIFTDPYANHPLEPKKSRRYYRKGYRSGLGQAFNLFRAAVATHLPRG